MQTEDQGAQTAPKSHLMTRREAAQYLGVTEHTLEVWASEGRYSLPFVKIGRLAKYRKADLDKFISDRVVGGER